MTNRNETLAQLISSGMPREDAEIVLDLMHHGSNEVVDTIKRVTLTAPEHLQGLVVFGILAAVQKNSTDTILKIAEKAK